MRDALLRDLSELQELKVITTYDTRLPLPQHANQTIAINHHDSVWQVWEHCMANADAIWPIAPETGGVLSRLTELASRQHKALFGCPLAAVNLAASKHATCQALRAAGISTVPTYLLADWPQNSTNAWVAKPDDGAGCKGSGYFESSAALLDWMKQGRETTHIIQPYQQGIPASVSMLCKHGQAWLLSCNRQKITPQSGKFIYTGSVLNGMAEHWKNFEAVARQIADAIPGLAGYVGVDLIVDGDRIHVLEINPRLTTSYAGLHEAMGCNPARLVMDLLYNEGFQFPQEISRNIVEITLGTSD
jgi:predicted ATP-grasp superfamily ATP-dependent carboligase